MLSAKSCQHPHNRPRHLAVTHVQHGTCLWARNFDSLLKIMEMVHVICVLQRHVLHDHIQEALLLFPQLLAAFPCLPALLLFPYPVWYVCTWFQFLEALVCFQGWKLLEVFGLVPLPPEGAEPFFCKATHAFSMSTWICSAMPVPSSIVPSISLWTSLNFASTMDSTASLMRLDGWLSRIFASLSLSLLLLFTCRPPLLPSALFCGLLG